MKFESYTLIPEIIPALPRPVMTRPTIKVTDEGAAAQMIEPTVNMPTADANTFLNSKSE